MGNIRLCSLLLVAILVPVDSRVLGDTTKCGKWAASGRLLVNFEIESCLLHDRLQCSMLVDPAILQLLTLQVELIRIGRSRSVEALLLQLTHDSVTDSRTELDRWK